MFSKSFLKASVLLTRTFFRQQCSFMSTTDTSKLKLALCQISVTDDKQVNFQTAANAITKAATDFQAQIVSLPECWNSPYATSSFPKYAEPIPKKGEPISETSHPSTHFMSKIAAEHGIFLIGGSIPEKEEDGRVYNTCIVMNPTGEIVSRHRKVHLFDIDVPGKITFKESDTLSAGDEVTVFDTPYGKVGTAICYDIRFPELSMLMSQQGAKLLVFPGAFNLTTGPAHWELLQRARAVDNQLFVAAVSPARGPEGGYQAWGHSSIINPWGEVIGTTEDGSDIVCADINLEEVEEMRKNIPTSVQKRTDIYKLEKMK